MPDLHERWRRGWLEATAYDWAVEREPIARVMGRLVWGTDARRFYRELARLHDERDGIAILDVPCGGGVAFRGLLPGQRIRYVAADLSPVMLRRARREAERRSLTQVEFVEADVEQMPFDDESFDLCISFTGLHCFPRIDVALAQMRRVLRQGGELRGSSVVTGAGLRQTAYVKLAQRAAVFGDVRTANELRAAIASAGFADVTVERDAALAYFNARRP